VKAEELSDTWLYVTVIDPVNEPCFRCLEHEQNLYSTAEVEAMFEWLEKPRFDLWLPQVHPNCRCQLFGYSVFQDVKTKQELGLLPKPEDVEVREEYQKVHDYLDQNKLPKPAVFPESEPSPSPQEYTIKVVTDELDGAKRLSDKEYDDVLSGLLSAGYITAAIYDLIVARRKKKQENKQP
jgi:hypothetical protein